MRILIIENDKELAGTLKTELSNFYTAEAVFSGLEGEYLAQISEYDLVITADLLPDMSGLAICQQLRQNSVSSLVLVMTKSLEAMKKIELLDAGADDCLSKPFDIHELLSHVKALLRRPRVNLTPNIIQVDDLTIDLTSKVVCRNNQTIYLRRKELDILEYLARNLGRVITREMMLEHIWDSNLETPDTNIIDVHIKYLRDRIDKNASKKLIKTVYGLGYKLEC